MSSKRTELYQGRVEATFEWHIFFSFSVKKSSKIAKMGPKMVKIPLFTPGGQNMQLRNKSREIK